MANGIRAGAAEILRANASDVAEAKASQLSTAMVNRLTLNDRKIESMAAAIEEIAALPDIIGETIETINRPNGLVIRKTRVPMGVIGMIYESRPNVTSDVSAICIKTGNGVVLRGGKEALRSSVAIVDALRAGLKTSAVDPACIQIAAGGDRREVTEMLSLVGAIDVIVPRGGPGLIREVVQNAKVPVIETGAGNCHVFVDSTADLSIAQAIIINAKCTNPSVCNAAETLLVHEEVAGEFLPPAVDALRENGVEIRGCERTLAIVPDIIAATAEDWEAEYLDLILAVKVVTGLDEAISHINTYGTRHSEAIITSDEVSVDRFTREIDAACVYVNASTRFTDGGEFGFGAEIGISTQKLHARGPMGLREMTSHKYIVSGAGQTR
jgi:glutamate-5-semialdehyde dehydrogenase